MRRCYNASSVASPYDDGWLAEPLELLAAEMRVNNPARELVACLEYAGTVERALPIDVEADRAANHSLARLAAERAPRKL
jgi:hypothetical protein